MTNPEMTEALAELLSRHRRGIVERRKELERFRAGEFRLFENNRDITGEWAAKMEERIQDLEALVDRYDPDGLTALESGEGQ